MSTGVTCEGERGWWVGVGGGVVNLLDHDENDDNDEPNLDFSSLLCSLARVYS